MKSFKNFLLYFLFIFSILFLIINEKILYIGTIFQSFIYGIFIIILVLLGIKIHKQFIAVGVSFLIIFIYLLPYGNITFGEKFGYIDKCNYKNHGATSMKGLSYKEGLNQLYQNSCSMNNNIMSIPFIVNTDITDSYLAALMESNLSHQDVKIEYPILNKYLFENFYLKTYIDISYFSFEEQLEIK